MNYADRALKELRKAEELEADETWPTVALRNDAAYHVARANVYALLAINANMP
jgi:hypothetical protein